MADPFTQTELGLWIELEAYTPFTSLVRTGNRIKFCVEAKPDPEKDQIADNDMPEVSIQPTTSSWEARGSNCTIWQQTYAITIRTGDKRTSRNYNPLKWAILRAVVKTFAKNLDTLTTTWGMPTGTKLMRVWPGTSNDGKASGEGIREGWACLCLVNVSFAMDESVVTA